MFGEQQYGHIKLSNSFKMSFKYILYTLELHHTYPEQHKIPCNTQFTNRLHMIAWDSFLFIYFIKI